MNDYSVTVYLQNSYDYYVIDVRYRGNLVLCSIDNDQLLEGINDGTSFCVVDFPSGKNAKQHAINHVEQFLLTKTDGGCY